MASLNRRTQPASSSTARTSTARGDTSRPPSYYYSIESMAHSEDKQDYSPEGTWLPPKALDGNIRPRESGDLMLFHFDGEKSSFETGLPQSEQIIAELRQYKCCSIYHDEGSFWSVGFNAIRKKVGNGQRTDAAESAADENPDGASQLSSSEDDNDTDDEWRHLTFNDRPNRVSFARRRGRWRRLITSRADQIWAERLLPDRYQTHHPNGAANEGGLVGELPLLVGLMTFTIPNEFVTQRLPGLIRWPWEVSEEFARISGWRDKRGMVVTIYLDDEPVGAAPDTTPSIHDTLSKLEQGHYGTLLP